MRMAGLVEALALRFAVRVVAPVEAAPPDGIVVGVDGLPDEDPVARLVAVLSPQPRLGHAFLGPRRSRALLQAVADHRPGAMLFAAGYLAAAAPTIDRPIFVDFPYLSVRRDAPDRSVSAFESLKARWWEPVEARRAVAVSASTPEDVARLASWGGRALLVSDGSTSAPLIDAIEEVVRAPRTTT